MLRNNSTHSPLIDADCQAVSARTDITCGMEFPNGSVFNVIIEPKQINSVWTSLEEVKVKDGQNKSFTSEWYKLTTSEQIKQRKRKAVDKRNRTGRRASDERAEAEDLSNMVEALTGKIETDQQQQAADTEKSKSEMELERLKRKLDEADDDRQRIRSRSSTKTVGDDDERDNGDRLKSFEIQLIKKAKTKTANKQMAAITEVDIVHTQR